MDLTGSRLVLNDPDDKDVARSLYILTTPLSAPTARKRDDAESEEVTVPSSFLNLSTHRLLLISHLETNRIIAITIVLKGAKSHFRDVKKNMLHVMKKINLNQGGKPAKPIRTYLYTSPSPPLAITHSESGVNVTARALPFIFRSATQSFDLASTKII